MRESVQTKARRYLGEGRLQIVKVDGPVIVAICRGGGARYELGHDGRNWHCDCPARVDRELAAS